MSNKEAYNNIFVEVFNVDPSSLGSNFKKESVESWDSVHQLNIVTFMEETFDIMLDPEDIMAFTSYDKGLEILAKNNIEI